MATMTVSTQQFHGNPASVEQAALAGPVFVADDGSPTLVILNMEEYRKLGGREQPVFIAPSPETRELRTLADLFHIPGLTPDASEFELQELQWETAPVDLS